MRLAEVSIGSDVMSFMDWLDKGPCDDDDQQLFTEFGHRMFKAGWTWVTFGCYFMRGNHRIYLRGDWMKVGYAARLSGLNRSANVADLRDLRGIDVDDTFAMLDEPPELPR